MRTKDLTIADLKALIRRHWGEPRGLDARDYQLVNQILQETGSGLTPPASSKPATMAEGGFLLTAEDAPGFKIALENKLKAAAPVPKKKPKHPCAVPSCYREGHWGLICAAHLLDLPDDIRGALRARMGKVGRPSQEWLAAAKQVPVLAKGLK